MPPRIESIHYIAPGAARSIGTKCFKKLKLIRPDSLQSGRAGDIIRYLKEGETHMDKKTEIWRAVKFTLFSASAGIIEIVSFALLNELTNWSYWPCYLIALILSVLWNFTLNRKFTFRSANNVPVAMLKVAVYYAVFTPLSTWLGSYLADTLGWNEYLVTAINMILNFVTEFLYDTYVVFRGSIDTNDLAKKQKEKEQK